MTSLPPFKFITRFSVFTSLVAVAIFSLFFSLFYGSATISIHEIFHPSFSQEILLEIRLPRTLSAFVVGGLLALAGALMQALLRNPLADPYVLGTSSGAAIMTLLCIFFGWTGIALTFGAWIGSVIAILMVFALSMTKTQWQSEYLILTGIALTSGFSAIISLILLLSPDHVLRNMLFWLVGDLSETHIPFFEIIILLGGLLFSVHLARELNILVRGEKESLALGINVTALKIKLFLLSALLTATAVTLAGCIGFVGLIIPHLFRLTWGYDHRLLLPGCILLGGSFLVFADTLARTLLAPQQLPVGIIMTLIGIPIFLILLRRDSQ
jgi:iron complex transport system permease protein